MSWGIEKKGPLFVSAFRPLLLIIGAIISWMVLQEKLYVGTVVGSVLIVIGLYAVVWGETREMVTTNTAGHDREEEPDAKCDGDEARSLDQGGADLRKVFSFRNVLSISCNFFTTLMYCI
ncbi:hypothetical protein RHMOL_Rhmol13G0160500 [Rhododendron molle]|uniref:Uncharacterized protein n=1 Tax=Rhododendron molle TaxID=49168 RepID=A0ACC0L758_RHOML|nr:hypothetical protein RHMOL_Rhmol13G0160500 [Rhododendron molle]